MSARETAPGGERPRRPRSLELDVLRGVAILLVLLHHPQLDPRLLSGDLRPVAVALWRFAWSGVDLFFVLSGFLVGGLLLDELCRTGTLDARRFLIRRAFRIWPSYLVLVAWIFVSESPAGWRHGLRATLPNLLHVQNYFGSPRMPTWSLAVEEHFYVVLPFVLLALVGPELRGRRAWFPAFFVAVAALCLGLRARLAAQGVYEGPRIFFPTHLRVDSLLFGVLLAWVYHLRPQWLAFGRHRRVLTLVGLVLVSPMIFVPASAGPFVATVGFTLLYLGYGAILIAAVTPGGTPPRTHRRMVRAIAAIGTVSYPMYLWFVDVGRRLPGLLVSHRPPDWLRLHGLSDSIEQAGWWLLTELSYVLVTVAVGALAAAVVERPFLALRERWFPSRAAAL